MSGDEQKREIAIEKGRENKQKGHRKINNRKNK